jgi:alpha-beta hydrolase superfamily lysophospholipase
MTAPAPNTDELTGSGGRRLWAARWTPAAGPPRAAVLLVHGYGEHLGRYDHVVTALLDAGYVVHGLDHHGHGRSAGRRAACRRFDDYVDDAEALLDRVLTEEPGRPVVLYGHSMGGLIATRLALRRQADLAGLIATSAAYRVGDTTPAVVKTIGGALARLVPDLPVFPSNTTEVLSRDPEVARLAAADPLCYQGRTRLGFALGILTAGIDTRAHAADLTLPLLIMHGTDDRLTSPAGSKEVYDRAASVDKTFRAWPACRHELHNELDRADVVAAILAWLDAHTRGARREERGARHDE